MTSHEIRRAFLSFFESKQHKIVPSAPLVLKNDPTLMFTNSGMVQFKDFFLGNGTPPAPRIADTQKCLRVSGKHNDLEDVGFDGTHHTMFEMLGNWSFGDYFKEDAIAWSWEFLTGTLGLPKDRLYATVFGGDAKENLASDEEARNFWRRYLPDNQILDGSKKDNFWEMGDTGPCGPCSEIHYDFRSDEERAKIPGEHLVNKDDPRVVEIWNNVFMQFERRWREGGAAALKTWEKDNFGVLEESEYKKGRTTKHTDCTELVELSAKHVDTGMGFERLCMVVQNKHYTYDTDVFTPLLHFIEEKSGKKYTGSYERTALTDVAMRVVADHIRAVAFTIADGQLPASGGAGYVIRRILRRAVRYSYSFLDIKEPFFNSLVPILASEFADVFPELKAQEAFVQKVILEEEKSFLRTLESGLKRLEGVIQNHELVTAMEKSPDWNKLEIPKDTIFDPINGAIAFELFDTYGFPLDLTELILKEKGHSIDNAGFEKALTEQKARSKADAAKQVGDWTELGDGDERVEFVGYDQLQVRNAKVLKYRTVEDKKGTNYHIVLSRTPFYAESGGQVGDSGHMVFDGGERIEVLDTKKENDLIIHVVDKFPQQIEDENVFAQVNAKRRSLISKNHSVGHLLHAALHQVLGSHALQKGQSIDENRLRFDFAHFNAVTKEELAQIENIVNQKIRENIALEEVREMPIADAQKTGAIMLFGEKYGEKVRVITFDKDFSIELCGGTHVAATGEIGLCKIVSEGSVTAGVRRVEVLTDAAAENHLNEKVALLAKAMEAFKNPKDLLKAITDLQEENKELLKEKEQFLLKEASMLQKSLKNEFEQYNGFNLLIKKIELNDGKAIKTLVTNLEREVGNALIVLGSVSGDKAQITIQISDNLTKEKGFHAGNLVKALNDGKGGGQPFFAAAGGIESGVLDGVLGKVRGLI